MSLKGKISQMESVRLSIHEHLASVGEQILINVRLFVLERLGAADEFISDLFQREMETLETLLERQNKLLDVMQPHIKLHRADVLQLPVCKEVSREEERSPSLVQEEPEPPHIKYEQEELLQRPEEVDWPMLTLLAVNSENDYGENRDTELVASTSTKTQADVEDCGTSHSTSGDQLLSSHCSESYITEDSADEWEPSVHQSPLNTLNFHKKQHVEGQRLSLSNKQSQDLKSSKETQSMQSDRGKKSFNCTLCSKMFYKKGNLKRHMMTHTGEKPFFCKVCRKRYNDMSNLKKHMKTHTGEKSFNCTVCGHGFNRNCDLKMHMTTHTGEKPFTCKICSKSYRQRNHLKTHMMTHTGEKPFTCEVCGRGCIQKCVLKIHMRTHTGEKPFTCEVCSKGFSQTAALKYHMRTHTVENQL